MFLEVVYVGKAEEERHKFHTQNTCVATLLLTTQKLDSYNEPSEGYLILFD